MEFLHGVVGSIDEAPIGTTWEVSVRLLGLGMESVVPVLVNH